MNLKALIKTWRAATNIVEWMGGAIFNGDVSTSGSITTTGTGSLTIAGSVGVGRRIRGPLVALTYGPSIAIDASLGNLFTVTITDNVAFVTAAPTNPPSVAGDSQEISITYRNASGGAHGAGTWNAVFKTQATVFPAIANGFSRTIRFKWDGTNWVEMWRSAADIAN